MSCCPTAGPGSPPPPRPLDGCVALCPAWGRWPGRNGACERPPGHQERDPPGPDTCRRRREGKTASAGEHPGGRGLQDPGGATAPRPAPAPASRKQQREQEGGSCSLLAVAVAVGVNGPLTPPPPTPGVPGSRGRDHAQVLTGPDGNNVRPSGRADPTWTFRDQHDRGRHHRPRGTGRHTRSRKTDSSVLPPTPDAAHRAAGSRQHPAL